MYQKTSQLLIEPLFGRKDDSLSRDILNVTLALGKSAKKMTVIFSNFFNKHKISLLLLITLLIISDPAFSESTSQDDDNISDPIT